MENETLEMLKRSAVVPSTPQIITRFLEITENPEFSYQELVDVLRADPGMVGDLLRLVNSSFFGVTKQIDSLRQAVTLLGIKRVRSLVLGRYMVDHLGKILASPIDHGYFWRRSLATAVLAAKFIARAQPRGRDAAFVSGLLADVGVIIMAEGLGDPYEEIARRYCPRCDDDLCELERERLGVTHADVSAMVLEHWQLPENICLTVAHHHDERPDDALDPVVCSLARAVNGAGLMAKLLAERPDQETLPGKCREAADLAGLDLHSLANTLDEIEIEIEELAAVLRVDVIASDAYDLIAKVIQQSLLVPAD